ncbi:MAG: hypothetical protein J0H55_16865 [Chitinophagaceae bacterium]|nr:hypothetical protein [Chitinophagaceae bacterium]
MIKSFLVTVLLISYLSAVSQSAKMKSSIGISIPVIWNNSEATYYQLGSPKYPGGKATSYGLNIDYSHSLYNGIYGKLGIGYFKQSFRIVRPFNYYDNPGQLLYSTQSYNYNNVQLLAGIGYIKKLYKNIFLNGYINYNYFNSFNQKYIISNENNVSQKNGKSFSLGEMINLGFGINRNISRKISLGVDFLIPIYTHWNKDETFYNNHYSSDEQQIARNKFSAGIVVSCNYNF